ncbi:unnamed protein product [Dicrocoelium dendriticum]|nr:unnamed protein product [Dicrocoelium dendriticum]
MKMAAALGNHPKLFQLIQEKGSRRPGVSETIRDESGQPIYNLSKRLERWVEQFERQFNRSELLDFSPATDRPAPWPVSLDPPSRSEVERETELLKLNKAAGPDDLPPTLFKSGGPALVNDLHEFLVKLWDQETAPTDWSRSVIVPIFKGGSRSECGSHNQSDLHRLQIACLCHPSQTDWNS